MPRRVMPLARSHSEAGCRPPCPVSEQGRHPCALTSISESEPPLSAPKANLPLLQRELLHCARLAKQTPAQYLAQHEQLLLDANASSPIDSSELLLEVNENGKRGTPDRYLGASWGWGGRRGRARAGSGARFSRHRSSSAERMWVRAVARSERASWSNSAWPAGPCTGHTAERLPWQAVGGLLRTQLSPGRTGISRRGVYLEGILRRF